MTESKLLPIIPSDSIAVSRSFVSSLIHAFSKLDSMWKLKQTESSGCRWGWLISECASWGVSTWQRQLVEQEFKLNTLNIYCICFGFCGSFDRMESGPHISLCIVLKSFCLWRKGTFDFKSSSGWHWIQCNVCVNSIARRLNNESKKSSFHSKRHNKKHNNSIELNNREWIDECFCDRLSIIIINIYVCSTYGCGRWVAKVGTWGRRFNYEQIFIVSYRCFQPFKASDLNGVCAWYLRWFLMLSLSLGKGRHHLMRVDWSEREEWMWMESDTTWHLPLSLKVSGGGDADVQH